MVFIVAGHVKQCIHHFDGAVVVCFGVNWAQVRHVVESLPGRLKCWNIKWCLHMDPLAKPDSRRLLIHQPQLYFHSIANLELLDFAGDCHGEFGHELDVAGHFVVGYLAFAEIADFAFR